MTPEEVNGLIAKRAAAFSRLDAAALGALYAENCVVDTPAGGGTVTGRDANENVYGKKTVAADISKAKVGAAAIATVQPFLRALQKYAPAEARKTTSN